jgi:hypothetical protein
MCGAMSVATLAKLDASNPRKRVRSDSGTSTLPVVANRIISCGGGSSATRQNAPSASTRLGFRSSSDGK